MDLHTASAASAAATGDTTGTALIKGASAWAVVGITSWSDIAAMLAACYTGLLICEWVWKHGLRDLVCQKGGRRES